MIYQLLLAMMVKFLGGQFSIQERQNQTQIKAQVNSNSN